MKKILIMVAIVIIAIPIIAHPAKNVDVSYDNDSKILTVKFNHPVRDNADHFIYEVVVEVNKKEVITQEVSIQDTKDGGELVYKLADLKPGDKITVETKCNKGGKKSAKLTIE